MRVWAFVSQKGGSGKSTLSTQLAVHAVECGEKVLILDMDPQGSAETWHQKRGTDRHPGALRIRPENLQSVLGKSGEFFTLIMIDTVPHTDKDALVAIRAANLIICPTQPSLFDLVSLGETATLLSHADAKTRAICVVNALPPGKGEAAIYAESAAVVNEYGLALAKQYICHRRAYVTSTNEGRGVTEMGGDAKKAADEIKRLWLELTVASPTVVARKETV